MDKLADECWAGHDQGVAIRDYCKENNISLWIHKLGEPLPPLKEESDKKRKKLMRKLLNAGLRKIKL